MTQKVSFNDLRKIIIAVDPAVTTGENSDETGIVVVASGPHITVEEKPCQLMELTGRCPGHGYVIADLTCRLKPHAWAERVVAAYDRFQADKVVAEVNNGGDFVGTTIYAVRAGIPYKAVNASRGKHKRAEPVAALWEQGRMHFVTSCQKLEDELVTWTPDVTSWSPNRLDALVWGVTELGLIGGQGQAFMRFMRRNIEAHDSEKPTLQEKKAQRQLARVIRLHPKYGRKADPPRYDRNCQHRWDRFGRCCFCGTFHVEETMKIRRGKGA